MISKLTPASWIAVAVVAAVQTAVLATMVYGRVSLLRDGREIVSEVIPVDPRDLFRGDYVILGYSFTREPVAVPADTVEGDTVYVTLKPGAEAEKWDVVAASSEYPSSMAPENVVVKGTATNVYKPVESQAPMAGIRYGIESYFVPEGTGLELEKQVRDKRISAVLAVGKSGDVAIKALVVDSQRVVEEPLL